MVTSFLRRLRTVALLATAVATPVVPVLTAPSVAPVKTTIVRTRTVPAVSYPKLATPVRGQDVSWPECPKGTGIPSRLGEGKPMPSSTAKFVLVGLTNGPAFYPNPCLAAQAAWVASHHVYVAPYAMTTYPTSALLTRYGHAGPYQGTSLTVRLRNVGWAQAQFNLKNMRAVGLSAPVLWMDVEYYPVRQWSTSTTQNRAVFEGALAAYQAAGLEVGTYSTRSQWAGILGSVRYGLLEWHTTGPASLSSARKACSAPSIQGGRTVLAQWWTTTSDYDVMCPGYDTVAAMKRYFHKF